MRVVQDEQMIIGEVDIAKINFDLKSRDDIPKILRGLQYTNCKPLNILGISSRDLRSKLILAMSTSPMIICSSWTTRIVFFLNQKSTIFGPLVITFERGKGG